MKIKRHRTKAVRIGSVFIGGNHPVAIQSMAKTRTADVAATIEQIKQLERVGCEVVRVAVKDMPDARAIKEIKKEIHIPLVADIHFNWRLAIESIENGADKIRLNPGNIFKRNEVKHVVSALRSAKIPLRIGVNSGSVKSANLRKTTMADKLVASCLAYIRMIERFKFNDLVISLKASTVFDTVEAYRRIARHCGYPIHLGVTATGSPRQGAIKSSIGCGILLAEGIGDTLRISLTDKPEEEVAVAKAILEALGIRRFGPEIISCPTCGRCEIDLIEMVRTLEEKLSGVGTNPLFPKAKVAVMGCVVNGPGEAREADIGVAFGKREGLIFKHGKPFKKALVTDCPSIILEEIRKTG